MKVSYATQVLSSSVANLLNKDYPGTEATAKFCKYFDQFFDCVNVRHLHEGQHKRKDFLAAYESPNDPRFSWLENDFLQYLKEWKDATETRHGNFSSKEREKMFISRQTHEGIMITVKSLIETTRFVLGAGMIFFLSEKVNQDCTEEHFGRHRRCGGRNTNPTLHQIGYQENQLRIQRSVAPVTGNTSGCHAKREREWNVVDGQPLPKRDPGSGLY